MFSTLRREHKYILDPPPQLVPPKPRGSACTESQNRLKKTLQMQWKTTTIELNEGSLLSRRTDGTEPATGFHHMYRRKCSVSIPPYQKRLHCQEQWRAFKTEAPRGERLCLHSHAMRWPEWSYYSKHCWMGSLAQCNFGCLQSTNRAVPWSVNQSIRRDMPPASERHNPDTPA